MADLPRVSIVFTSYNHKRFLKQALDSLVAQSYPNIEIIIVDDCSTDGSQEILKTYADNARITLHLLEKNTGSYVKASNYGFQFATGEYVLFAQCDDWAVERQVDTLIKPFLADPSIGVVFSESNLIDENDRFLMSDFNGRETSFRKRYGSGGKITGAEMRRYLAFSCVIPNLSAALMKRELYERSGKLPERYLVAADWALYLELAELTDFYFIREPLNNFRQHGTTIRSKVKIRTQLVEIYTIFYEHIVNHKLGKQDAKALAAGAGAVWFAYFLEHPKQWLQGFPEINKELGQIEKHNMAYLFRGGLKHAREICLRKAGRYV